MRRHTGSGAGSVLALMVAGGLSVALVWTLTTNDPYWRLIEAQRVPVPAFAPSEDFSAALATAAAEFSNEDQGAVSQKPELPAYATRPAAAEAAAEADATPVMLPAAAAADAPRFDPELDPIPALSRELAEAARSADAGAGMDSGVAIASLSAPLPPIGAVLRDDGPALAPDRVLAEFVIPSAPAQPRLGGTVETEAALALSPADRIDVQRRLALAGFDPSGFDGVFGDRTRTAIADFQAAWNFPASGFLDRAVVDELNVRTEGAYHALRHQANRQPTAAPVIAMAGPKIASADAEGSCARYSDGRIVERQSLACDIAGLSEKFAVSFGRSRLAQEDAALTGTPPQASAAAPYPGRRPER